MSDYDLKFSVLDLSIAQKWLKHVEMFIQNGQPWDDPKRFYNFPNTEFTQPVVRAKLQEFVDTINNHSPGLIDRKLPNELTQDDLNYLHHVFEVYHGLYDTQNSNEFFWSAPAKVQDALGDLNIWIHRYESLGKLPRFVATWKYKPYRDLIADEDFKLFDLAEDWGDLRLNYCEIGKSLYDFWHDRDDYIAPEAFKPLHHFCFDFTVRFTDKSPEYYRGIEQQVWQYFDQHQEFFAQQGYQKYDPKLSLGSITVAKIVTDQTREQMINAIGQHQQFKNIQLI